MASLKSRHIDNNVHFFSIFLRKTKSTKELHNISSCVINKNHEKYFSKLR